MAAKWERSPVSRNMFMFLWVWEMNAGSGSSADPLQRARNTASRLKDGESSATWRLTAGWLKRRMMLGVHHWEENIAGEFIY